MQLSNNEFFCAMLAIFAMAAIAEFFKREKFKKIILKLMKAIFCVSIFSMCVYQFANDPKTLVIAIFSSVGSFFAIMFFSALLENSKDISQRLKKIEHEMTQIRECNQRISNIHLEKLIDIREKTYVVLDRVNIIGDKSSK